MQLRLQKCYDLNVSCKRHLVSARFLHRINNATCIFCVKRRKHYFSLTYVHTNLGIFAAHSNNFLIIYYRKVTMI